MKVTELAKKLNTTPDTVRYYTRKKLLTPGKLVNGYKYYSQSEVVRLKFILSARQLGFSVNDIVQIFSDADHGKSACPLVRSIIKKRLDETEQQFQEMLTLRQNMTKALKQWEKMEDKAPSKDMVCHLIESINLKD